MRAGAKPEIVRARSPFDRRIARRAAQQLWDLLPGTIARILRAQAKAKSVGHDVEKGTLAPAKAKVILAAIDTEFKILKEGILDRTLPSVQRVDLQALMAMMPPAPDDLEAQAREAQASGKTDEAEQRTAVLEALRDSVRARAIGIVVPIDVKRSA